MYECMQYEFESLEYIATLKALAPLESLNGPFRAGACWALLWDLIRDAGWHRMA